MRICLADGLHPALRPFVARIYILEGRPGRSPLRVLPDGRTQILINFAAGRVSCNEFGRRHEADARATLIGLRSRYSSFSCSSPVRILAVEFFEHAAFLFFRAPMAEFTNRSVPLDELWRDTRLLEKIQDAAQDRERFAVVQEELVARLDARAGHSCALVDRAVRAFEDNLDTTVEDLAYRLGLHTRTLQRMFRNCVGMSPISYGRILRVRKACRVLARTGDLNRLDFALSNGFYDQAHFNRDFRDIVGLSPSDFARDRMILWPQVR